MSYKLVRVANLYPEFLRAYYAAHLSIKEKSYREQLAHMMENSADIASSYTKCFEKMGIDASIVITNAEPLLNQWKIENRCEKTGKELIVEQLKLLAPAVLWLDDITFIDKDWMAYVRSKIPSIRIITGHMCAPYTSANIENLKLLDFLITCTPCMREEFEERGIKTYLVYHAFETTALNVISVGNNFPEIDLLFVGSLYTGGWNHRTRIEYLDQLLHAALPIKIYGNIDPTTKIWKKVIYYHFLNSLRAIGAKGLVKYIPTMRRYETYGDAPVSFYSKEMKAGLLPPVFGLEQLKLLSKAAICFNIHIEIARGCAGNLRLFEATGVGSCLVTDWKENLKDLFELEKEVVTYKSKEECVDKMKWLLANPSEMKKIGEAGQIRTLRDHTIQRRVNEVDKIFRSRL